MGLKSLPTQTKEILNEACRRIESRSIHTRAQLYDEVFSQASKLAKPDAFFVSRYNGMDDSVSFLHGFDVRSPDALRNPDVYEPLATRGPTAHVIRSKHPYWSQSDDGRIQSESRTFGAVGDHTRSTIHVPISHDISVRSSRILGTLSVQSYEPEAYDEVTLLALTHLGKILGARLASEHEAAHLDRPDPWHLTVKHTHHTIPKLAEIHLLADETLERLGPDHPEVKAMVGRISRLCYELEIEENEFLDHPVFAPADPRLKLSEQQTNIVTVLAECYPLITVREIGDKLHISENTVKRHLANIYDILDIHSQEGVVRAVRPFL